MRAVREQRRQRIPQLVISDAATEQLRQLTDLVAKWSRRINLVSRTSAEELWGRHVLDSAQLYPLITSKDGVWADLGSGGGFPGLVLAILARDDGRQIQHILVESDRRKAEFLRHASADLGLEVIVLAKRIEEVSPLGADVVTARALAPMSALLGYCARHLTPDGIALLPKGQGGAAELAAAAQDWTFTTEEFISQTEQEATVYRLQALRPRRQPKGKS